MGSIGFIGLGAMGGRMVKRLLDAGHSVVGYNRTAAKAQALAAAGMKLAASPRQTAEAAEVVFSMVTNTEALDAIAHGADGVLAGLHPGSVWVEMSTVSPGASRRLAEEARGRGAALLDAPVSGSVLTLEQGQLSIMVGGEAAALERVRPYLLAIGPTITHVGPNGLAVTMKIATNLGLVVQMLAFCEAVLLAEKSGIDRGRAVDTLLKSVIASPMVRYRGPFVLGMPEEAWFNVPMMQKDVELALELGHQVGVPLLATSLCQTILTAARGLGLGEYDFAVVFDVLARLSGLPPSPKAIPGASQR
jgi:3-hydroxyisobutyrate dehydrogenase-like beta-hydroxyacid dehydrogenase